MKHVLAIIPARGGSKGIPGKNIRVLSGKPLLAHSIEHARAAADVTRVVVSTDDQEIGRVAEQYGAEVVWRPAAIAGDTASSESALVHVLDHLRRTEQYEPELVVFLQATSPLRREGDVQRAIETLHLEQADSLLSVSPVHGFVWRAEAGTVRSFTYDHRNRPRRQDAPEDLIENGSIYVFKPWVLQQHNNRLGGKIALFHQDAIYSFQIDEPGDLVLLEALMAAERQQRETSTQAGQASVDFGAVRLLVLDFDGVLTDNRVLVTETGEEAVVCSRGDGMGIGLLKEAGVEVIVLSKETNPVVAARCRKLRIDHVQSCDDKITVLQRMAAERGLQPGQVAYVGNDINDLECMVWAGLPIAVADAEPEAKAKAKLITPRPGGYGAVRDVANWIAAAKKKPVRTAAAAAEQN